MPSLEFWKETKDIQIYTDEIIVTYHSGVVRHVKSDTDEYNDIYSCGSSWPNVTWDPYCLDPDC